MYLQRLEIQGFKSFANKTTLEFNRELTAVVGPNGSGKSNVADALRWVLGEQSLKLLRGKKAEDVIFAGSDLKGRLGMAEVSIYLNNEDGSAPIDYSELVITRRVFRDGQSEYLLNNAAVRLQDIQLLLAKANVGQKSYSVIGQGMIDSVLVSSPAERKEFFEEATGVKQFQIKRDQAINKLTQTYDNLDQANLLVQEIEPRLKVLTRQVKRLEKREELEGILHEMQKGYYRFRWHGLLGKVQETQNKIESYNKSLLEQQAIKQDLRSNLEKIEKATSVTQAWRELQEQQTSLRNRLNSLIKDKALAEAAEEIGHIKRGEGELAWLKQRLSEVERELENVLAKQAQVVADLKNKQENLTKNLSEQTKLGELFEKFKQEEGKDWLNQELSAITAKHSSFKNKIKEVKNLNQLEVLVVEVEHIEDRLKKVVSKLQREKGGQSPEFESFLSQRETLVASVSLLQTEIRLLTRTNQELSEQEKKLKTNSEQLQGKLATKPKVETKAEPEKIGEQIKEVEKELLIVEKKIASFQTEQEASQSELFRLQRGFSLAGESERKIEHELHELQVELARLETKQEDLEQEMAQEVTVELSHEIKAEGEVVAIDEGATALEIQRTKHQLELTGGIEPEVINEYQQTKTRFDFLTNQINDLEQAARSLESIIHDLDETIEKKFLSNFKIINSKFSEYFQVLFGGGKAQLILQKFEPTPEPEPVTPVEGEIVEETEVKPVSAREKFLASEKIKASLFSGVEIQATPPGKKLSSITALSGGEKALSSIALISAIMSFNPSPFVVLDEVDAALDESNSERFAAIVESFMKQTQFITITHNRATMRRASILYGVTIGDDGVSKLLSVKLDEAKQMAGTAKKPTE